MLLTDHIRYMDQGTFSAAKEIVLRHASELGATFDFEPDAGRTKLLKASTPQEFNMTYLAPFDLKVVPNGSLDLVISRACLEHIPVSDLEFLMAGLRPKLKKGGFMAHAIDNSDHFSHIDPSISRVNFLTWSEAKHRLIYQIGKGGENRLRHHEYAALFRRTGYVVVDDDALIHDETLQTLSVMNLSAPYDSMAAEQLAAISSWYILRPE